MFRRYRERWPGAPAQRDQLTWGEWVLLEAWREVRYRAELTRYALKQHCRPEMDWYLRRRQCYWLTAKCVLAVVLGLERSAEYDNRVEVAHMGYSRTSSMEWGEGAEWDTLRTQRRGLGYDVSSDGYP